MGAINRKPLVSILMAAYNSEKTIQLAIRSVQAQTFEDWELIIINDCSTDNTPFIVTNIQKDDARIKLLNNEINSGVSISRKNGLKLASGKWIAVLDSDDMWDREKLEKQLAFADKTRGEFFFTGSSFIDAEGNSIDWQLHVPETLSYRKLLKQNLISNSSVLINADLYKKYYAVGDKMHEDFAIWLSITREGYTAYGIDEPLLIYRLNNSSKSSNKIKAALMNWNTYRYIGLPLPEASYYMMCYTVNGIRKYKKIRKADSANAVKR